MSAQIAAIVGLVVMFIIATVLPINMGALAFAGAFIIGGLFVHMSAREIFAGFPADIFLTLVGITYLFAIAQKNGTIDWLVGRAVRLVRGQVAYMPWVMFTVAGALTGVGAVSPAAVAIIAPIALRFASKYRISPLLIGLMVIHGAQAGGFSPISVYGGITNQLVERAGLPPSATALFLASLFFNFGVAVLIYFFFDGHRALRLGAQASQSGAELDQTDGSSPVAQSGPVRTQEADPELQRLELDLHRSLTLLGLIALVISSLVFELNIGAVAISIAVLLALLAPRALKGAVDQISWSTVLLITGVITYIAVLQKSGAVDLIGGKVSGMGVPVLAALLLCYIGGVVSAFASSVAVLGATIPLAVPFLLQGHVGAVGVIAAIAVSSTVVDVSPFSTNGALVVASAQGVDKDRFYREMLLYSAIVVVAGPLAAWLVMVLPGLV